MKTILLFLTGYVLIPCTNYCYAQQDSSLAGSYAGTRYYKYLSTDPWTIVPDTVQVLWVDTVQCIAPINLCGSQGMPVYSSYTYCTSMPANYYAYFYSVDSLAAIADSNTILPPCVTAFSLRFYGKRINNNSGVEVNEMSYKMQELIVYPNPGNTILYIECKGAGTQSQLKITDLLGNEVKKVLISKQQTAIDISNLNTGVYFVNVDIATGIATKKIVIAR